MSVDTCCNSYKNVVKIDSRFCGLTRKVARQLKDPGMELLQDQVSTALKPGRKLQI